MHSGEAELREWLGALMRFQSVLCSAPRASSAERDEHPQGNSRAYSGHLSGFRGSANTPLIDFVLG